MSLLRVTTRKEERGLVIPQRIATLEMGGAKEADS